ncbi:MAG: glycosyltransferase [Syntrophobacterales bacterium]|nr:glycosyltransferase [Syntrophobacterales bacterium]
MKDLGIIIPVYNEAENIGPTISAIEEHVTTSHSIYIVYDFDDDNTLPVAHGFRAKGVDVRFLKSKSPGVLSAIKTGLSLAKEEYLLVTMADLSDDYSVVDRMMNLGREGFDIVCGSRYASGGKQIGGPLLKKSLSCFAGFSLRYIAGIPTRDVTNSFKLYRKRMVSSLALESNGGFEIGMEIVIKGYFEGYRITEIPCLWQDRLEGMSRFKIMKWMPKYLKWYFFALRKSLLLSEKKRDRH